MKDLLKDLLIEEIVDDNSYTINYEIVNNRLKELKKNSYEFLKSII